MIIRMAGHYDITSFEPAEDDIAEARAAGVNWKECLQGDVVAAIYGRDQVLALGGNQGDQCWFVLDEFTESLPVRLKLRFRKLIMGYRDQMLKQYPVLWNYVWVGNKSHIRFLKSIGAEFQDEFTESPITGERFQLFIIKRR